MYVYRLWNLDTSCGMYTLSAWPSPAICCLSYYVRHTGIWNGVLQLHVAGAYMHGKFQRLMWQLIDQRTWRPQIRKLGSVCSFLGVLGNIFTCARILCFKSLWLDSLYFVKLSIWAESIISLIWLNVCSYSACMLPATANCTFCRLHIWWCFTGSKFQPQYSSSQPTVNLYVGIRNLAALDQFNGNYIQWWIMCLDKLHVMLTVWHDRCFWFLVLICFTYVVASSCSSYLACLILLHFCMHGKFWRPRRDPLMDIEMEVSDDRAMLLLYALLLWSIGQYVYLGNALLGLTIDLAAWVVSWD